MIRRFLNYAVKVDDLDAAAAFHRSHLDATETSRGEAFGCRYVALESAGTSVYLFDRAVYETALGITLPLGFLHAVYEVDDFDRRVAAFRRAGIGFFFGPTEVRAAFGARRIAFFEAPGGVRTEIAELIPA
jgi:catechol 2,3-dioxygenase-like lactoylglutathione lyase family enzyme